MQDSPRRLLFFSDRRKTNRVAMCIQQQICFRGREIYAWSLSWYKEPAWRTLQEGDVCIFGNADTNMFYATVRRTLEPNDGEEPWAPRFAWRHACPYAIELDEPVDTHCTYKDMRELFIQLRPPKPGKRPRTSICSHPLMIVTKAAEIQCIVNLMRDPS